MKNITLRQTGFTLQTNATGGNGEIDLGKETIREGKGEIGLEEATQKILKILRGNGRADMASGKKF